MKKQAIDYRGVSAVSVIDSLKRAEAFIDSLNMGPECAKAMTEWRARNPYTQIAAAQTRAELATVMRTVHAEGVFSAFHNVLHIHALADNKNAGARKMYRDLSAWGALSAARFLVYTPQDAEMDAAIVKKLTMLVQGPGGQTMLAAVMHELAQVETQLPPNDSQRGQVKDLLNMGGKVAALLTQGGDAAQFFTQGDLRQRHLFIQILRAVSGVDKEQVHLKAPGPFNRYGVVLSTGGRPTFDDLQKKAAPIKRPVGDALSPFYETDEVRLTGIGGITDDFNKQGLIIDCTRPAIAAVVAALPGYEVIDSSGKPVAPPNPKGPSAPTL